jgi:hypothetical protein
LGWPCSAIGRTRAKLVWLDAGHFVLDENAAQISCEIKAEFAGYNLASRSPLRRQRAGDLSQEKWRTRHDSNVRPAE